MAFIAGTSFVGATVAAKTTTCRRVPVRSTRAIVSMNAQKGGEKKPSDAGFTAAAERLNGRAAMMGFIIAVATEVLNSDHPTIVQQVTSVFGQ